MIKSNMKYYIHLNNILKATFQRYIQIFKNNYQAQNFKQLSKSKISNVFKSQIVFESIRLFDIKISNTHPLKM